MIKKIDRTQAIKDFKNEIYNLLIARKITPSVANHLIRDNASLIEAWIGKDNQPITTSAMVARMLVSKERITFKDQLNL